MTARFPLAPLEAYLTAELGPPIHYGPNYSESCGATTDAMAMRCGVTSSAWRKARARGLPLRNADRWAIRAGLHPAIVWGDDWWADA